VYETCHLYKAASNVDSTIFYSLTGCDKGDIRAFVDANSNCQMITAYGGGAPATVQSAYKQNVCKKLTGSGSLKYGVSLSTYCTSVKAGGF
jgi:hypothetical protein